MTKPEYGSLCDSELLLLLGGVQKDCTALRVKRFRSQSHLFHFVREPQHAFHVNTTHSYNVLLLYHFLNTYAKFVGSMNSRSKCLQLDSCSFYLKVFLHNFQSHAEQDRDVFM